MIFSILIYLFVLGVSWGIQKNWPKTKGMTTTRRLLVWSLFFRCLMMTWFASAIWVFTFYHAAVDGFKNEKYDLENPRILGKGNGRQLVGLDLKYPTEIEEGFW